MELVLPRNYVEIEEEEMMYLDGGDMYTLAQNINGIATRFGISYANRQALGIAGILQVGQLSFATAAIKYGVVLPKLATLTGNPIVIGIAALGSVAAITYLWNKRVFY